MDGSPDPPHQINLVPPQYQQRQQRQKQLPLQNYEKGIEFSRPRPRASESSPPTTTSNRVHVSSERAVQHWLGRPPANVCWFSPVSEYDSSFGKTCAIGCVLLFLELALQHRLGRPPANVCWFSPASAYESLFEEGCIVESVHGFTYLLSGKAFSLGLCSFHEFRLRALSILPTAPLHLFCIVCILALRHFRFRSARHCSIRHSLLLPQLHLDDIDRLVM